MTHPTDEQFIRHSLCVAQRSRQNGNHPFGAILVDPHGKVLLEAENTVVTDHDCTGHAETNLMRQASRKFSPEFLAGCTLYTSAEPCAMCSGAIYWGNVGRVVFGLSETDLLALTGDNPENPTLSLPCREVFGRGQRPVEVVGPLLADEAATVHHDFWG